MHCIAEDTPEPAIVPLLDHFYSPAGSTDAADQEVDTQELLRSIWPAAVALFLSISTSTLVFPFFTYVPSSGFFGEMLPQVGHLLLFTLLLIPPAMEIAAACDCDGLFVLVQLRLSVLA